MKIEEVKKKYKNEWVLLEVLKENELGKTLQAKVLVHSKDRDEVYDALEKVKPGKVVETLYTGPFPKKHAVIFYNKQLVTLKSVSVLGRKVKNVQAVVHDLPQRSYVDGLLGLSFLKNFKVTLDFHKGILELD